MNVDATLEGNFAQGTSSQLDMKGMEAGASFHAFVQTRKVRYLEIAVNGDAYWDGNESDWVVCDPQTGAMTNVPDWHEK